MKMNQTRRTFISSLSATGCAASLSFSLPAFADATNGSPFSVAQLQKEIARYGQIVQLKHEGQEIRVNVQVQRHHQVFDACSGLAEIAPLHIAGNEWSMNTGPYRVLISNQCA